MGFIKDIYEICLDLPPRISRFIKRRSNKTKNRTDKLNHKKNQKKKVLSLDEQIRNAINNNSKNR